MNEAEFVSRLERALEGKVADIEDIVGEYREHFARKLADGHTEEEVAARLGPPEALAAQYDAETGPRRRPARFLRVLAASLAGLCALPFLAALFVWALVLGVSALAILVLGGSIALGLDPTGFVPFMPRAGAALLGLSLLALALLLAVGTVYMFRYAVQLCRAFFRWAANLSGPRERPPLPIQPGFRPVARRRMRTIALLALAVTGAAFVAAFASMAIEAGSFEFWHVWSWFRP